MTYTPNYPTGWHDLPTTDTPITGATLDHIEDGIAAADSAAAAAAAAAAASVQPGDLATVATTGTYSDLAGKPTIPATAADVGAVPTTRTVNGQALSGNVDTRLAPTGTKTAAYTAAARDLVLCDATAGTFAVTLPTAPAAGTQIAVKKVDNSANNPTVSCGGSDTFESGATSFAVSTQWRTVVFQYSSGVWYTVAMYLSVASLGIPSQFSDLAGNVAIGQLPAGSVVYVAFTSATAGTAARPTARTDLLVIWVGDSTTSSTTLPTNRIAGDIVLTKQA